MGNLQDFTLAYILDACTLNTHHNTFRIWLSQIRCRNFYFRSLKMMSGNLLPFAGKSPLLLGAIKSLLLTNTVSYDDFVRELQAPAESDDLTRLA
jgi:hypothetical protein